MQRGNLSRRGFLQRSLTVLAGAGVPLWYAREILDVQVSAAEAKAGAAANSRLVVGAIGIGSPKSRGMHIVGREALNKEKVKDVEVVAVCDVDKAHMNRAADEMAKVQGKTAKDLTTYSDYRKLLDHKGLNAVIIATPDQWHALVAIDAMKKGLDVYCEKPLTLTIAEGIAIAKVAKETGRTFQVGSQQRSEMGGKFRLAAELVRNGRLGKIKSIECLIGKNPVGGPFKPAPVPEGLDFEFWLGPCPKIDYCKELVHYEYRWNYAYSGGKLTDWGAHHLDIAQWAMGMDESGPTTVEGKGEKPNESVYAYNCHPTFKVDYTYANGVVVSAISHDPEKHLQGAGEGVRFNGEDGKWIVVSRGKIEASDKKLLEEPLGQSATRLYQPDVSHMANFFNCIRTKKPTICTADIGHRSATVCHLGAIALRSGKKLEWDAAKQEFKDKEMNKWLSRENRAPWKLSV